MGTDEEGTLATLSAHRAVTDALISQHAGRICGTAGDKQMHFRIGINVGDDMVKGGDIFGDGVNIAARLEGLSEAGGICISRGVRDHIRHKVPYGFEDLGEQTVKNIAQPLRVFRLLSDAPDGSHAEPPPATIELVPGPAPSEQLAVEQPPAEPTPAEQQSVEIV